MTFDDLFRPVSDFADSADSRNRDFLMRRKHTFPENVCVSPGKKSGLRVSALSAPPAGGVLVPLDRPFAEGQRYREAGATEVATRLDCYLEDPAGPWVRHHGVLLATCRIPA